MPGSFEPGIVHPRARCATMRLSELHRAMREEFGEVYAGVLMREHWFAALGGSADDALAQGVSVREVWQAVCVELQVPERRRHGRGLVEPT